MPQTPMPTDASQHIAYAGWGVSRSRHRGLATGIASFAAVLLQFPWAFAWILFCWGNLGLHPTPLENALAFAAGVAQTIVGLLLGAYSVSVGGVRSLYGMAGLSVIGLEALAYLWFKH